MHMRFEEDILLNTKSICNPSDGNNKTFDGCFLKNICFPSPEKIRSCMILITGNKTFNNSGLQWHSLVQFGYLSTFTSYWYGYGIRGHVDNIDLRNYQFAPPFDTFEICEEPEENFFSRLYSPICFKTQTKLFARNENASCHCMMPVSCCECETNAIFRYEFDHSLGSQLTACLSNN